MSPQRSLIILALVLALFLTACGSDDATEIETADSSSQPVGDEPDSADDAPIPVEPDGGIGDGAEPLPGAEDPPAGGTWHGAEVPVTNCPGTDWQRVEANEFSFSVPADFVEADVQPIDSEVGIWSGGNNIEVAYDYGWYSGSIAGSPGAENEPIDYSGIAGEQTIVRTGDRPLVGVFFEEVKVVDGQADRLSLVVTLADVADEIIGRCIVGSIEWTGR